jgi:surface antigen
MSMLTSSAAKLSLAAVLVIGLAGCNGDYGTKETIGTLAGAALGAWAGSAIDNDGSGGVVAVAAGTAIGGLIGNQIGRTMDKVDRQENARTQFQTLEYGKSGQPTSWYNPDSGNSGTYVAQPAFKDDSGKYCREFTQKIVVGGKAEEGYGTACRQADGTWKIVS